MSAPQLIVGLQVYEEANRFLPEWVKEVASYADSLVVLDDCSQDETVQVIYSLWPDKPLQVARSPTNLFRTNELVLRKWLWAMLKLEAMRLEDQGFKPWILMLDADEFMEDKFKRDVGTLLRDEAMEWYGLKFLHFWKSREKYRVDKLWKPSHGPRLIRYRGGFNEKWRETPLHCGSIPMNYLTGANGKAVDYIIKHYGYVLSPEEKHERYSALDPQGKYAPKSHYDSMLDEHPTLVQWKERA